MDSSTAVRFAFLGGVGEIGKNISFLEAQGRILVIDAGLAFPGDEMLGIDIVLPDWTYLLNNQDRIEAIILTHGHEDHVGGLPYFLRDLGREVAVFGSSLTLGLVREKLAEEYQEVNNACFHVVSPGDSREIGPFAVDFIRVNHSIPDGFALGLSVSGVRIVHSGDFKFDLTPIDGKTTDFAAFARWGDTGVDLFISDCTNVEMEGFTPSEKIVKQRFEAIFAESRGRIIVATFASNINRIQLIIDVARIFNRRVITFGRSMVESIHIAQELGYLNNYTGVLADREDLDSLTPGETVLLTTGTQGEPLSALSLLSRNEIKDVRIEPGDTVIISARAIPGNEALVNRIVNNLSRQGAKVLWRPESGVHVSGHAAREELKMLLNLVKPAAVIPFHGEPRHQRIYSELAQSVGMRPEQIFILDPGDVVTLRRGRCEVSGTVPAGMIFVDGAGIGDVGRMVLKDRKRMSDDGIVIVALALREKQLVSGPRLESRGFVFPGVYDGMLEEAEKLARSEVETLLGANETDPDQIRGKLKAALGRFFFQAIKRQPLVLPVIMESAGG